MAQDKSYGTSNIMARHKWDNGTGQELWHNNIMAQHKWDNGTGQELWHN